MLGVKASPPSLWTDGIGRRSLRTGPRRIASDLPAGVYRIAAQKLGFRAVGAVNLLLEVWRT